MGKRRDTRGRQALSKKFFLALLGLAGLGVGVWLFRSRGARGLKQRGEAERSPRHKKR